MNIELWRILLTVVSMSLSGSVLFILYLVMRQLFKKRLPPRVYYVILILVIGRMILPFSPEFSLMNTLYSRLTAPAAAENAVYGSHDRSAFLSFMETSDGNAADDSLHGNSNADEQNNTRTAPFWRDILVTVWLTAAVMIFAVNTLGYFCWSRYVMSQADCCILHKRLLIEMMGKKRKLDVMVSRRVHSPMLVGVIDPAIILPCEDYSDTELQTILRHELRHYYRHDTLVKWLVVVARSLHWFNPLMPLIVRATDEMCEYACDRAVTNGMNLPERKVYIRAILKTAARQSHRSFLPTASLSAGAKRLEKRFENIAEQNHPTSLQSLAAVTSICLVLASGISLGTVKFERKAQTPSSSEQFSSSEKISLSSSSPYAPRRENTFTNIWYRYGYERMAFQFTAPDAVFDENQKLWFLPHENQGFASKPTLSGATEDYYFMCSVFKLLNFENYERVGETMTMLYFPSDALQVMFYNELYFYLDRGGDLLVWLDFQYVKNHPHSRDYPDYLEQENVISVYHVPDELYDEVTEALYHYAIEYQ